MSGFVDDFRFGFTVRLSIAGRDGRNAHATILLAAMFFAFRRPNARKPGPVNDAFFSSRLSDKTSDTFDHPVGGQRAR